VSLSLTEIQEDVKNVKLWWRHRQRWW